MKANDVVAVSRYKTGTWDYVWLLAHVVEVSQDNEIPTQVRLAGSQNVGKLWLDVRAIEQSPALQAAAKRLADRMWAPQEFELEELREAIKTESWKRCLD